MLLHFLCRLRCLRLFGVGALLCGVAHGQSPLLVVDAAGGPGTDFTSIAEAVDVAPAGAVVLVKAGSYGPFEIVSKSLVVTADVGAVVKVVGGDNGELLSSAIVVRELGADEAVVLEGLQIAGTPGFFVSPGTGALLVDGCAGQIRVQDCQLTGGFGDNFAAPALEVVDSPNVLVTGATLQGGSDLGDGGVMFAGAGLQVSNSRVHLWDSQATGGSGGQGVEIDGGFLFAARSVFKGGPGFGLSAGSECVIQVNGGTGLLLGSGSPKVVILDTQLMAGPADHGGCSLKGMPSFVETGTLQTLPGTAPAFLATSPVLDGAPLTFSFADASPGDSGAVLVATALGDVAYLPKYAGALAVGSPWFFLIGPVSPEGSLDVTVSPGDALRPGTAATFHVQGVLLKAGGGAVLAAPAAITLYDD